MEEKNLQQLQVIKCPFCGYEYTPDEIFYPDNVIGKTKFGSTIKDPLGKVLYTEYQQYCEPLLEERFICDNCERQFVVELETKFRVREEEREKDFTEKSVELW